MPAITPDEVAAVKFPIAKDPGSGYQLIAVDDFLDQVQACLQEGGDVAALAHQASFPIARRARDGYSAREVDDFLDRLMGVEPEPMGGAPELVADAPEVSVTHAPAAAPVMEPLPEERGLFSRLFGRR